MQRQSHPTERVPSPEKNTLPSKRVPSSMGGFLSEVSPENLQCPELCVGSVSWLQGDQKHTVRSCLVESA